ncbi:hypothetical protein BDZ91DRAFT_759393 [Kalaharituber pfeilii]|nr:hypothetical protein BDZ91DRAFT_759393 [Kalaharituber pfeilii]
MGAFLGWLMSLHALITIHEAMARPVDTPGRWRWGGSDGTTPDLPSGGSPETWPAGSTNWDEIGVHEAWQRRSAAEIDEKDQVPWVPSPDLVELDPVAFPKSRLEPVSVLDPDNPLPGLKAWWEREEERREAEERGEWESEFGWENVARPYEIWTPSMPQTPSSAEGPGFRMSTPGTAGAAGFRAARGNENSHPQFPHPDSPG